MIALFTPPWTSHAANVVGPTGAAKETIAVTNNLSFPPMTASNTPPPSSSRSIVVGAGDTPKLIRPRRLCISASMLADIVILTRTSYMGRLSNNNSMQVVKGVLNLADFQSSRHWCDLAACCSYKYCSRTGVLHARHWPVGCPQSSNLILL